MLWLHLIYGNPRHFSILTRSLGICNSNQTTYSQVSIKQAGWVKREEYYKGQNYQKKAPGEQKNGFQKCKNS